DEYGKRFVAYFLSYAEAHAEPTPEDYDSLEAEKDNLIIAAEVALSLDERDIAARIVDAVGNPVTGVLGVRGYWDDAIRLIEQTLSEARRQGAEYDVGLFSHNLAMMRMNQG